MRSRDDAKQQRICAAATRLFASRPFHKVHLDDIARAAGVGKGTIYLYCRDKQELFISLLDKPFAELVERLKAETQNQSSSRLRLRLIVRALVGYAYSRPEVFELMRTVGVPAGRPSWEGKRQELSALIEDTIRRGIRQGVMHDTNPKLSAVYLTSMVRSMMLYGPRGLSEGQLVRHATQFCENALCRRAGKGPKNAHESPKSFCACAGVLSAGGRLRGQRSKGNRDLPPRDSRRTSRNAPRVATRSTAAADPGHGHGGAAG